MDKIPAYAKVQVTSTVQTFNTLMAPMQPQLAAAADRAKTTYESLSAEAQRKASRMREMYLISLHIISISAMQMSVNLLVAFAALSWYYSLTPLLVIGALLLVGAALAMRWQVGLDISYLYAYVFDVDERIKGLPWGQVRMLLFTAIGMLLLDGGLFKAADSFLPKDDGSYGGGTGLPGDIEATLLWWWDSVFWWVKAGTFPICFLGLSANIASIRRGAYIQPTCDGKCCGGKPHYRADAEAALKGGTWETFQKGKKKRTTAAVVIFAATFAGVLLLIPVYWVVYSVITAYIGFCPTEENPTSTLPIDLDAVGKLLPGTPDAYFAAVGTVDINGFTTYTCKAFDNLSYWLYVTLVGLFMHLPGIGGGWSLLNRYTMIMSAIDAQISPTSVATVAVGVPVNGPKSLV